MSHARRGRTRRGCVSVRARLTTTTFTVLLVLAGVGVGPAAGTVPASPMTLDHDDAESRVAAAVTAAELASAHREFLGVTAVSEQDVWAVGNGGRQLSTRSAHYDGLKWRG